MKYWFYALSLVAVAIVFFWAYASIHKATETLIPSDVQSPSSSFQPTVNDPVAPANAKG